MSDDPLGTPFAQSDSPGPQDAGHLMRYTYASTWAIWLLTLYGFFVLSVLVGIVISRLPELIELTRTAAGESAAATPAQAQSSTPNPERALLLLVVCVGALGGVLHLFSSLAKFVGTRTLYRSWLLFYYFRPPVGAILGLFVYLVLRMGVLGQGDDISAINVYGVLAFAALSGMFSKQAIDKLAEVFDTLFQKTKEKIAEAKPEQLFGRAARSDLAAPLAPSAHPSDTFAEVERTDR